MPIDQQTFNRLKGLWDEAGGDPGHSDVAAAIAFAESSGCQYALAGPRDIRPVKECKWTVTSMENSCGYWQINLRAHPDYSAPSIFGELENAQAAVEISKKGEDFGAWTTYTNGSYRQYLTKYAGQAPTPPSGGDNTPSAPAPPDAYGDTATLEGGEWEKGWAHLTSVLAHRLPNALTESQRAGERTLRAMAHRSKVIR